MTGESDEVDKTVKWVADKGVNYGYAYDEDLKLFGKLGLNSFPSAILVDPFGNVVYSGHPSRLSEELIDETLANVLPAPMGEWPEALAPVADKLTMGHFGPAKRALGALEASELTAQVGMFIDKTVDVRVAGISAMVEDLDVAGAMAALEGHADVFAGYDSVLSNLGGMAKTLESDRAKAALAAQEKLVELEAKIKASGRKLEMEDMKSMLAEYQKIATDFEGKAPGKAAATWVSQLERALKG